jgi:hypothetical protein
MIKTTRVLLTLLFLSLGSQVSATHVSYTAYTPAGSSFPLPSESTASLGPLGLKTLSSNMIIHQLKDANADWYDPKNHHRTYLKGESTKFTSFLRNGNEVMDLFDHNDTNGLMRGTDVTLSDWNRHHNTNGDEMHVQNYMFNIKWNDDPKCRAEVRNNTKKQHMVAFSGSLDEGYDFIANKSAMLEDERHDSKKWLDVLIKPGESKCISVEGYANGVIFIAHAASVQTPTQLQRRLLMEDVAAMVGEQTHELSQMFGEESISPIEEIITRLLCLVGTEVLKKVSDAGGGGFVGSELIDNIGLITSKNIKFDYKQHCPSGRPSDSVILDLAQRYGTHVGLEIMENISKTIPEKKLKGWHKSLGKVVAISKGILTVGDLYIYRYKLQKDFLENYDNYSPNIYISEMFTELPDYITKLESKDDAIFGEWGGTYYNTSSDEFLATTDENNHLSNHRMIVSCMLDTKNTNCLKNEKAEGDVYILSVTPSYVVTGYISKKQDKAKYGESLHSPTATRIAWPRMWIEQLQDNHATKDEGEQYILSSKYRGSGAGAYKAMMSKKLKLVKDLSRYTHYMNFAKRGMAVYEFYQAETPMFAGSIKKARIKIKKEKIWEKFKEKDCKWRFCPEQYRVILDYNDYLNPYGLIIPQMWVDKGWVRSDDAHQQCANFPRACKDEFGNWLPQANLIKYREKNCKWARKPNYFMKVDTKEVNFFCAPIHNAFKSHHYEPSAGYSYTKYESVPFPWIPHWYSDGMKYELEQREFSESLKP